MTQVAESLLKSLLEWSEADRVHVADRLYESIEEVEAYEEDSAAMRSLIEERLAEADRGEFAPGSAFEVLDEIRRELTEETR